ncbi:MAG: molecular chaperone GrpE [Candidatus Nanohaloarchaea archaeon]|jgi:molecular chaperone GrpE
MSEDMQNKFEDNLVSDGGEPEDDQNQDMNRAGRANSLTGLVNETLESQQDRNQTAADTIDQWESEAAEETGDVVQQYNNLRDDAGEATEWEFSLSTEAGEFVDDLDYHGELGIRDYAETQSEQIEGLTGTIRRFSNMIGNKQDEVEEKEERLEELEEEREEAYEAVDQEVEEMDDEDVPEVMDSFDQFRDAKRDSVDSEYDGKEAEVEEDLESLRESISDLNAKLAPRATERSERRDEAQTVYNQFAEEAEAVVSDNHGKLKESLGILRELEIQQETYEEKSVESGVINQNQGAQADARTEAALAYVSEALDEIDELEDAVEDHYRVTEGFSSITKVDTRELEHIYDDLVDEDAVEGEVGEDQFGTDLLRQRVYEAAESITADGYDSIRELRDIADDLAEEYREE